MPSIVLSTTTSARVRIISPRGFYEQPPYLISLPPVSTHSSLPHVAARELPHPPGPRHFSAPPPPQPDFQQPALASLCPRAFSGHCSTLMRPARNAGNPSLDAAWQELVHRSPNITGSWVGRHVSPQDPRVPQQHDTVVTR